MSNPVGKIFFSVFCLLFSVFCSLAGCRNQELHKSRQLMLGTFVEVISSEKEASEIVFKEIKRVEGLLSKYDPASEVARLNRLGRLKVSPETFYVIKKSKEFYQSSHGAFDITVSPLLDLWGFTDRNFSKPSERQIKDVLKLVGSQKIILQDKDNVVKFSLSGVKIDLGAIAKGYALDCAVKKLKERGIKSCLIDAGGQIYALGDKRGEPWRIAIRNPRGEGFSDLIALKDGVVSTSGDYEQYFLADNRRYAHIFDPKTGYPADSGVISVTVTAPDGLTADALSTAVFVLGREKGLELMKKYPSAKVKIVEGKD
ncbi:MAG: FAD:protein FMN transferase [Candidatus Omnitrophica bacterium]|nr:FAD:protein FMN transferase [Candidatus Omnitrophota bacterium]